MRRCYGRDGWLTLFLISTKRLHYFCDAYLKSWYTVVATTSRLVYCLLIWNCEQEEKPLLLDDCCCFGFGSLVEMLAAFFVGFCCCSNAGNLLA